MKKFVTGILSILTAMLIVAALPTEADAGIYDDTLRLHILAASDSEEDQALKLRVRDGILAEYSAQLSEVGDLDDARAALEARLPDIVATAERIVAEAGYDYTVTASLGEEWYDTRDYGELSLPRGVYTSLSIKIGEGQGRNWWCVMYPPMCLDTSVKTDGIYTKEEEKLISNDGYHIKFKLLEATSELFKRRK